LDADEQASTIGSIPRAAKIVRLMVVSPDTVGVPCRTGVCGILCRSTGAEQNCNHKSGLFHRRSRVTPQLWV